MKQLTNWNGPQRITSRRLQEPVDAIRELQAAVLPGDAGGGADLIGYGIVTTTGPEGQGDFSDERYWVKWAVLKDTKGTATLADFSPRLLHPEEAKAAGLKNGETIVCAINLAEKGKAAADNHKVASGAVVRLYAATDAASDVSRIRYFFDRSLTSGIESCNSGGSPTVVNAFSASETADAGGGVPNTDGLKVTQVSRVLWSTTDGALYVYYRDYTYNSCGKLVAISGETKVNAVTGVSGVCT